MGSEMCIRDRGQPSNPPCDSLLLALLKSSTFNQEPGDPSNYSCRIDKKMKASVLVQAFTTLDSGKEGTLGWLVIDFEKKEIRDIFYDPENPFYLDFEVKMLEDFLEKCR